MVHKIEDIEKYLLHRLIFKKKDYYDNHTALSSSIFTINEHKLIFNFIDVEYQNGKTFDEIKLVQELSNVKNISYILSNIITAESYFATTLSLIELLVNYSKRLKLHEACKKFNDVVFNDESDKPVDELVNTINKLESGVQHDIVHIRDRVKDTVKEIELSASKKGISGITTGFNTLDMFTGGWQRQDLVIVGGASSMGKTSLALALSFNATRGNIPTAIFSYEMSANQLIKRIISSESDIKNKSLIEGTLTDNEWHKMHSSLKFIEDSPLYIDECSKTSLRYLLNRIRQYVITKKVKLIMVDYLQLVTNDKRGTNREQEVSQIARSLKNIAKELNISIIALSQLSRNVEKRQGCRPTLADLRESGEIEQAADIVMLVYRPEYYGFQEDEYGKSVKGLAEIIFAKGRNIGVGSKFLNFDAPLTKFKEIQKVYEKT